MVCPQMRVTASDDDEAALARIGEHGDRIAYPDSHRSSLWLDGLENERGRPKGPAPAAPCNSCATRYRGPSPCGSKPPDQTACAAGSKVQPNPVSGIPTCPHRAACNDARLVHRFAGRSGVRRPPKLVKSGSMAGLARGLLVLNEASSPDAGVTIGIEGAD